MDMNNQENYISLEKAATYLGVKPTTLRSWIKKPENDILVYKIRRMWKFKRFDLMKG